MVQDPSDPKPSSLVQDRGSFSSPPVQAALIVHRRLQGYLRQPLESKWTQRKSYLNVFFDLLDIKRCTYHQEAMSSSLILRQR
jgi:hypothetical protein